MLQHYLSTYGKKALRGHYQEISMERYQEEAQHNLARGRDWTGEKLGPLAQLLYAVNKGGLGVQRIMNESGATSAVHTIMGAASYYKGAWEQHNLKQQPVGKQPEVNETKPLEAGEKEKIVGDPNAEDKLDNLDFFEQQHPEFWDDKIEKEYNDLQRQQSNFDRSQSMNVQTGERLSEVKADVDVSLGKSEGSGHPIEAEAATSRIFTSSDPLVGDLATAIDKAVPGKVVDVNRIIKDSSGRILTDLDIELECYYSSEIRWRKGLDNTA
ncbi:hypothetical protein FACS189418_0930 [Clostridia bacterium]|nr:hypothetical protein FACS189418_0930 [Clostridia bacterium]